MSDKMNSISTQHLSRVSSFINTMNIPLILRQLSSDCPQNCCLTNGQKLSSIELIVYVFNVLKKKFFIDSKPICVKQLFLLVKQYMAKQLTSISGVTDTYSSDDITDDCDRRKLSFNNLLTDLIKSNILSIDVNKQTIGFCDITSDFNQWLSEVQQMLDNNLIDILQKYLTTQLQRFGSKSVDDIEMRLIRRHHYLFNYLFGSQNNFHLLDFIQCFPQYFSTDFANTSSQKKTSNDFEFNNRETREESQRERRRENDRQIHSLDGCEGRVLSKCRSFEVLSKTNKSISCLIGFAYLLDPNNRFIRLKDESIDFKIDSKVTLIYGKQIVSEELLQWLHTNDLVVFDVSYVDLNNRKSEWFVTSISRVQHLAQCYIYKKNLFSQFKWSSLHYH